MKFATGDQYARPKPYRIDKFVVPPTSRDRFMERLNKTHEAIDHVDGCEQNLVLEQVDGTGQFNIVTFVQWRDEAAYHAAKSAAQARQAADGDDPAQFMKELEVVADLATTGSESLPVTLFHPIAVAKTGIMLHLLMSLFPKSRDIAALETSI